MKTYDRDAKHLIRNYIDNVENYLHSKTRLHPNEIDNLLSEINDFVYLRSSEIASDPEDRVFFTDVLKAIEECGSPSEIGDFLDSDEREPAETESGFLKSRQLPDLTYNTSKDADSIILKGSGNQIPSEYRFSTQEVSFENFIWPYSRFKRIGVYRLFSLFLAFYITLGFLSYEYYLWSGGGGSVYSSFALTYLFFFAPILFFWEGAVIHGWKNKLARKGMDRTKDDYLVLWFFRLSLLAGLFKVGIIFDFIYFWVIPLYLISSVILERRFQSDLWKTKLSKWVSYLAQQISQDQSSFDNIKSKERLLRLVEQTTLLGRIGIGFLIIILLVDLLGLGIVDYNIVYYFGLFAGRTYVSAFGIIMGVILLGTYKFRQFFTGQIKPISTLEKSVMIWLVRLLTLRLYVTAPYILGSNYLLLLLILAEILAETFGGTVIRLLLISILTRLALETNKTPLEQTLDPTMSNKRSTTDDNIVHNMSGLPMKCLQGNYKDSAPQSITDPTQENPTENQTDQVSPPLGSTSTSNLPRKRIYPDFGLTRKAQQILKPFVITMLFLVFSFYEVILAAIILLTSFSSDGAFYVVTYDFNVPSWIFGTDFLRVGDVYLWIWYGLLMLGTQLIIIVMLDFYSLSLRQPEGVIVKAGRNLSRVWIAIILLGVCYRILTSDPYAGLQGIVISGLLVFSEITAWRNRVEHRKIAQGSHHNSPDQDLQPSDTPLPST